MKRKRERIVSIVRSGAPEKNSPTCMISNVWSGLWIPLVRIGLGSWLGWRKDRRKGFWAWVSRLKLWSCSFDQGIYRLSWTRIFAGTCANAFPCATSPSNAASCRWRNVYSKCQGVTPLGLIKNRIVQFTNHHHHQSSTTVSTVWVLCMTQYLCTGLSGYM